MKEDETPLITATGERAKRKERVPNTSICTFRTLLERLQVAYNARERAVASALTGKYELYTRSPARAEVSSIRVITG